MISLRAAIARAAIRAYTYPYRKRFASLSRSVTLKNKPYAPPKGFVFAEEVHGGVQVEKLTPPGVVRGAVLQFHGGGHTAPMNDMYRKAAQRLASTCGCIVYSIDYRTGADLTYPSVHDECYSAYAALCKTGNSYRDNCRKDPLYALPKRCDFETHEKDIRRISPYCGNTSLTDPYLSPAYADFHAFPQTLIQCGGLETSLSDNRMLFDKLTKSGCPARLHVFNGMWHDFMYMFPRLKESKLAWLEICDFVSAALSCGK